MINTTPEEEQTIRKDYEEYIAWCRKWVVPPEVISYEDFWRMAVDEAKCES